jgi:tight adherence protein B
MDPIALLAAGAVAGAMVMLVVGFMPGRVLSATSRLDAYDPAPTDQSAEAQAARQKHQSTLRDIFANSAALGAFNRVVERRSWSEEMARSLARADLALKPGEYLVLRLVAVAAALGVAYLLGTMVLPALLNPLALLVAAVIGYLLPRFWVARRQGRRLRAFNQSLADTITLIANSLRAGSSFLQSVELVARETRPPVSTEFSRVVREVSLGRTLEQALENLVRRVGSDDLELMTTAISIQYQVGGNLSEILDGIAFTIRERVRIKGEIRTLTAQQRLSGIIVGALPIVLIAFLSVIAPRFMAPMFERPPELFSVPLGVYLLAIAGVMMTIGFLLIRRIVNIKV